MTGPYADASAISTILGLTVAASITMLAFRLQRELGVRDSHGVESTWIPVADRLLIAALLIASLFGLLPLLLWPHVFGSNIRLSSSACAASVVLLAIYPLAIFAHYDLNVFGRNMNRQNRSAYNLAFEYAYVALGGIAAAVAAFYTWLR